MNVLFVILAVAGFLLLRRGNTLTAARVLQMDRASGVHPDLIVALEDWSAHGPFDIVVTSGLRTENEQLRLYAQGRTTPGKVVTYAAHASQSAHGRGAAVDVAVVGARSDIAENFPKYLEMGAWFEARGLVWGGRWITQFPPHGDVVHIEMPNWSALP